MDMSTSPAGAPPLPATVPNERSDARAATPDAPSKTESAARTSPTTLKYKFDWLLQRQVSAGTMSADKAAAMIKLFDAATGGLTPDKPDDSTTSQPSATDTPTDTGDDRDRSGTDRDTQPAAADRLVDDLRDHFATTGPYDDTGAKSPASPTGIVLDERA